MQAHHIAHNGARILRLIQGVAEGQSLSPISQAMIDTTNAQQRPTISFVLPRPAAEFEGRVYGPYLVIRTRHPLRTRARYIAVAKRVLRVGQALEINDADVNLHTIVQAESRL